MLGQVLYLEAEAAGIQGAGINLRDVSIAKVATLHSLLTGDLFEDAAVLCEPIYISRAEGALVLRLAESQEQRCSSGCIRCAPDALAVEQTLR